MGNPWKGGFICMYGYKTFTEITDMGPFVTKLLLQVPEGMGPKELGADALKIYVERKSAKDGKIIFTKDLFNPQLPGEPSKGFQQAVNIYPGNSQGEPSADGGWIIAELKPEPLGKRTEGTMLSSEYVVSEYKVTLTCRDLHQKNATYIFDTDLGDICPQKKGWAVSRAVSGKIPLKYAYYTPEQISKKIPLVIWLHGAGEGGDDPKIPYTGNKAVNLSSEDIQNKLGGASFILVPQCPTVWMDDGHEQLGRSGKSIYSEPLKACIDEFINARKDFIDPDRILIGGCSNGGFMTVRMAIDYPGFFAAGFPACEAFYEENITQEVIDRLCTLPLWFIHDKDDEIVNPAETSLPLYHKLVQAGAENIHFTYYDRKNPVFDQYGPDFKFPPEQFKHAVWVNVYNDDCFTDIDGQPAADSDGPLTLWQWLGKIHG
ncbi:MAG TPA: prolyl oligopeptidase family serine peptidase [Candidatus Scybalocola faecavium]|nr:prolyl oligopeptidase family serine peptidase [Candidatus Scybalocola faecavium]